jgi:hypothetical protein
MALAALLLMEKIEMRPVSAPVPAIDGGPYRQ